MDCPPGKVYNPQTKRCITMNGLTHKQLIKQGILQNESKCKDGEVLNPKTKRCIQIGTYLYKKLVKDGVINPNNVVAETKTKKSSTKRNCKNNDTFLMFDNVKDIEENDFIQTPDGFCFSARELFAYVNDSSFNNRNPHIPSTLFKKEEVDTLLKNHPSLLKKVKEYFEGEIAKQKQYNTIFEKNIDVLYTVGHAGKTCYFNNLRSWERQDSSLFQRSIESLQVLSEKLSKLKSNERIAFNDVKKFVDSANRGEMCIHGVGLRLINLFVKYFSRLNNVNYDPFKTGLYFYKSPKNDILLGSTEHRFSPVSRRIAQNNPDLHINLKKLNTIKPDMITERNEKNKHYKEMCNYEPYLVTENTLDEWSELSDWRKIMFGSNMCFDVLYLVKVITDNLNNAKNNNPDPKFPTNPFTQSHFTQDEIKLIKYTVEDNFIKINPALDCFISNPEFWVHSANWKDRLISKLDVKNRFVRLNNIIGGELHCHGMWNLHSTIVNPVERHILNYLNTARPELLRILIKKPSEIVPDRYYYTISKFVLKEGDFVVWE